MAIKHLNIYCAIIWCLSGVQGNSENATVPSSSQQPTGTTIIFEKSTEISSSAQPINATTKATAEKPHKVNYVTPITVLGYKPMTSFYHPEPFTLGPIVPPGTPWPNSPEGYQKTTSTQIPTLENKFGAETVPVSSTTSSISPYNESTYSPEAHQKTTNSPQKPPLENKLEAGIDNGKPAGKPITVLEYKPTRPSFLPEPSTINQLIPPGKPWPASPEEYTTLSPQLINRFPELTSEKAPKTSTATVATKATSSSIFQTHSTHIVLEYKPQRPWYLPDPDIVGQIVPPGKPWPASPEGYYNFSVLNHREYDASYKDANSNISEINNVTK